MSSAEALERKLQYNRQYQANRRSADNDIDALPDIVDSVLRERMLDSLRVFLEEGFPETFTHAFGPVQIESIEIEQQMLESGGRDVNKLEPRGYGKSIRSILGLIWAVLKGTQKFCLICSDSKEKADDLLEIARFELSENEVLLGCFPELACFHHLGMNANKARYQTYRGEPTYISIKGDTVEFPRIDGVASSGAVIASRPFRKARGKNKKGQRPTVIILDDIQATEDALSPTAIRKNLKVLESDIRFLGDRSNPVSIINNATIIAPDDFPDKLTRDKEFKTVRYKMVEQFPTGKTAQELWNRYQEIRQEFNETIEDDDLRARRDALEFYKSNREEMDGDSKCTWDYAYSKKPFDYEISSIQSAYNFRMKGEDAFLSECQNDPPKTHNDSEQLTKEHVKAKQNGYEQGRVPEDAEYLVCDIDVQGESLWYTIAAGSTKFDGYIVEKNVYPKQTTLYPSKGKLKKKLSDVFKGADEDSRIFQGLVALLRDLLSREYKQGDETKTFDKLAVDVKWNDKVIKRAIREIGDDRILAYNGHGIGPGNAPMASWKQNTGEQKGIHWHLRKKKNGVRDLTSDVNFWKEFTEKHFLIPYGQTSSLTLHKVENDREHHTFANHIKAEVGTILVNEMTGRKVKVYKALPGEDNEWLDTTAGAMCLLSVCGAECLGAERDKKQTVERKAVTYF